MTNQLAGILEQYDAFLIDLWGVVHDGSALYPGVAASMGWLAAHKKRVVFLSNAPRVSARAVETLTRLGIPRAQYRDVVTSGQVARDWLASGGSPFGAHYYYLGPGKDEDIMDGLAGFHPADMDGADFILCTGYEYDFQPEEEIMPVLENLYAHDLPMLCVNPDIEVVKQDGTVLLCAGAVAARYHAMGGAVTYVGKPHPAVYETCRALLCAGRLLAIGDNPATDIRGANAARIDSLLITGGVLKVLQGALPDEARARALCGEAGAKPTYVLPSFALGQ